LVLDGQEEQRREDAEEKVEGRIDVFPLKKPPSTALIELKGYFYHKEAKELNEKMQALLNQRIAKVILDMSHVRYMNSTAIAALTNCAAATQGHSGKAVLVALNPTIEKVLKTLGLLGLFTTAHTVAEAVRILS
jgi:anti-anti-sigma factor